LATAWSSSAITSNRLALRDADIKKVLADVGGVAGVVTAIVSCRRALSADGLRPSPHQRFGGSRLRSWPRKAGLGLWHPVHRRDPALEYPHRHRHTVTATGMPSTWVPVAFAFTGLTTLSPSGPTGLVTTNATRVNALAAAWPRVSSGSGIFTRRPAG
jgi:hypothetical protein